MNAPHANHPSPADLAAFAVGKLPDADAAAVAAHLESCPDCRRAAASAPGDSFVSRVRDARPSQPPGGTQVPGAGARSLAGPPPDLPPELARHPRYRVLRDLGRGGMGVVYQARQTVMNRQVVIKVINQALLAHPDAVERFRREVHAAAQLLHPNIVTAHDAEQAGDLHMLVMEFVPGQSLAEVLQKKGPLPVREACHYARQAVLGLQHAHEQGMVHRDIKPHNLMLTPKGQVKILDFGLAKMASERGTGKGLTSVNAYMGTPEYSAPEQATDAHSADIRADLYSLGCTLYCLLAGRPPFREETEVDTLLAHLKREPTPLPELRPEVPAALWAVVARLLAKDPARRYQTPAEAAQVLAPFVKAGPKGAAPPSPALPPGVAPAGRGTRVVGDTHRAPSSLGGPTARKPAPQEPASVPAASAFEGLAGPPPAAPRTASGERKQAKAAPAVWRRRPAVLAGAGILLLAVGAWLLAGVVFRVRVKTPDGEAVLVVEVDQPGAEVLVDGDRTHVTWGDAGKRAEVRVKPGTHKVEVKKDGFTLRGSEVEVEDGGRKVVTVRLDKDPSPAPARPAPGPADPGAKEATATGRPRQLWLHDHGYFIQGNGTDWLEKWDNGNQLANVCHEVQRMKGFIELRHYLLPITFRLYKDKVLIKDERNANEFTQLYEGSLQTEPAAADRSRQLWVHDHGYFIRGHGDDWFEKYDDGNKPANVCREVQRTKEFVELRHYLLPISFQLYADKMLIKDERHANEFTPFYEGEWKALSDRERPE
jgi:serine/threonine protein kinase